MTSQRFNLGMIDELVNDAKEIKQVLIEDKNYGQAIAQRQATDSIYREYGKEIGELVRKKLREDYAGE